jgi:hypothetical protein
MRTVMSRPWESPRLYSWSIVTPDDGCDNGSIGVSGDEGRALQAAGEALWDAPEGSRALVHRVIRSMTRVAFLYERLVARGSIDTASGILMWEKLPSNHWQSLSLRVAVTDPPEALADAYPPEAISAGLADAEVERQRLQHLDVPTSTRSLGRM